MSEDTQVYPMRKCFIDRD
ncbi:hypothetical protein R3I93_006662 [Phoxinus phoxinus]|uniref:Uncharacterized protein n=1 Tax=Phoxinus phoxinus TaxID=58324 RepID=A0AAN9D764_9TELE